LISFLDGANVEFVAKDLIDDAKPYDPNELISNPFGGPPLPPTPPFFGCTFFVREFSPQLVDFVFEAARAGGFSIEACGGGDLPTILVSESQSADLPTDDRNVVVVDSGADLAQLLAAGHEKWQAYRDQVMNSASGKR
jgi:hypothetical protein